MAAPVAGLEEFLKHRTTAVLSIAPKEEPTTVAAASSPTIGADGQENAWSNSLPAIEGHSAEVAVIALPPLPPALLSARIKASPELLAKLKVNLFLIEFRSKVGLRADASPIVVAKLAIMTLIGGPNLRAHYRQHFRTE